MRLGLDIDGVVCDIYTGLFGVAGVPLKRLTEIEQYNFLPVFEFNPVWEKVKDDENFWLSAPVLDRHIPSCCVAYISSRHCSQETTQRWLHCHGLDVIPLYQTSGKARVLRELGLDGLVDDKGETYEELRDEFPASFLVSRPWNKWVKTPNRIYRLEELDWRVSL